MFGNNNSHCRIRKGWTLFVGVVVLSLFLSGCGPGKPKVYRVGVLHVAGAFVAISDGFKAEMTELGYVEGENIVYEDKELPPTATSDEVQLKAKELVEGKVDLIFAFPTPHTVAAHAATQGTKIPVVFAMANPETLNLIKSVREPGGNMTGVRNPGAEILGKRLEVLIKIAPQVKRIWVGYDQNNPNTAPGLEAVRAAATSLGVQLVEVPATTLEDFETDLAARAKSADIGLDAIVTMSDGLNQGAEGHALLSQFAAEHKVPLCAGALDMVRQGGLFGNSANLATMGKLAAPLADKIFKGIAPGTISVVTPEQELYINYKVAQELGLTVPESLLNQANEIIR